MMRKIYMSIALIVMHIIIQGQQQFQGVNFGDMSKPVPSVSSLSTYTDTPVSIATGIPNISIPLLSLPVTGGAGLDLQLSYNPMNASGEEAASEVGTGWSLFKGGVISRQVNGTVVDEAFRSTGNANYEKNKFDDEYYYNLPGLSGKFKIDRDVINNTFKIIDLTPANHVKIEYTRESNDATLIISSFTITDDNGNRYFFNDYSSNAVYDNYYDSIGASGLEYKSAFFLTQIKNASNMEVAGFTYKKETKYDGSRLLYKMCRLEKMNSSSGNIEIIYEYDAALEKTMNDPYSIKKIILNNKYSKVSEYAFDYSYPEMTYPEGKEKRRQLERIKKMNGDAVLEQTSFVYYPQASGEPSQALYCDPASTFSPSNVLKRIIYPTKGVTEYVYEISDTFIDKNTAAYVQGLREDFKDPCTQYTQSFPEFTFDTHQSASYTFTVSGDPSVKMAFWLNFVISEYYLQSGTIDPNTGFPTIPPPPDENQRMSYTLKRGSEIVASSQKGEYTKFYHYPGQYTLTINIPYVGGNGSFRLTELKLKPAPYRNAQPTATRYRIKSVKRYGDINSSTAAKTTSYSYDSFSKANSSSGYLSQTKDLLFKNVKVTEGTGNGYVKYYFKTPDDFPSYAYVKDGQNVTFWPYYNLTEAGLPEKKEVYDEANRLLSRESYQYTFATADNTDYIVEGATYSKTAWISYHKQRSELYPSGISSAVLLNTNETTFRQDNYKPSLSKSVSADGNITENFYKYAQDKNFTALLNANMTGVLLESEIKKNGKTVGKAETRFENTGNYYPSSSVQINPNSGEVKTAVRYDLYDEKGNIVQYTTDVEPLTGKGNPVTIIWGYGKTVPIAKITGAKWSDIGSLANDMVAKSDADIDDISEQQLLNAQDVFRNQTALRRFSVITYSYNPLIGITTLTPPTGLREYYKYDPQGRLKSVTDANGNIVKEVKYNHKQ